MSEDKLAFENLPFIKVKLISFFLRFLSKKTLPIFITLKFIEASVTFAETIQIGNLLFHKIKRIIEKTPRTRPFTCLLAS